MPTFASLLNAPKEILVFNNIIMLIAYIVQAFFFMVLADKLNITNKWRAWIPVFNLYLFGEICEKETGAIGYKNRLILTFWMTFVSLILFYIFNVGFLGFLFAVLSLGTMICHTIFQLQGTYWIYKKYIPKQAILGLVISCLFMIGQIVFECIIMNIFRKEQTSEE